MIQITDIQTLIGDNLFNGASDIVGLIIFAAAIWIISMVTKDMIIMAVLMLPLMLLLSILGVISTTITFIMIIAIVIIIALNASNAIFGSD